MSYFIAKRLKVDKKNNKIEGLLADSCIRDYRNRLIYDMDCKDLYSQYNKIEDKVASLYYDLICGNIHTSLKPYTNYVCLFSYFEDFIEEFRKTASNSNRKDYDLYNVYLKYKGKIDEYTKLDCILKSKNYNNEYIVRVNRKSVSLNCRSKAKKFNSNMVKQNDWYMENYTIEYI